MLLPRGLAGALCQAVSGHPLLLHFRNLTAFPGGAKELLLRDLDQLFLASDCRHFNRTESLRCVRLPCEAPLSGVDRQLLAFSTCLCTSCGLSL